MCAFVDVTPECSISFIPQQYDIYSLLLIKGHIDFIKKNMTRMFRNAHQILFTSSLSL